jgi:hypothetical protein
MSPLECARVLRDALVSLRTKPRPPHDEERRAAFARAAGFEQGPKNSAAALARMDPHRAISNLKKEGFTREDVKNWASFYADAYERKHSNISAFHRKEVLIDILRAWPN